MVRELGSKASPTDLIEVDGQPIGRALRHRYVMFHKPSGCVTTRSDPEGRRTVYDLLYDDDRVLHTVGRLDWDSSGLLLLTNDGELTHRLTHPRYGIQKLYRVATKPWPTEKYMRLIRRGVELEDGIAKVKKAKYLHADTCELTLGEGRNREVRRIFETLGCEVLYLCRMQFGPLTIGTLREGAARPLKDDEVQRLRDAVGL